MEDFIKRLTDLMEYYGLTASVLADKISVQRSSISHLLTGRNKPSLDFVTKIMEAFPEVNLYWLLNGSGSLLKKATHENPSGNKVDSAAAAPLPDSSHLPSGTEQFIAPLSTTTAPANGNISKVIILYQDGTFSSFEPNRDE